jgi:hypothetical protein
VRREEGGDGLLQAGDLLGEVDEGDGEVAGAVQDGEAEGADQHHVAGGGLAALPHDDAPGEQAGGDEGGHDGVEQAEFFQVEQAVAAGAHLPSSRSSTRPRSRKVAPKARDDMHIGDDVDQLAVDAGAWVAKVRWIGVPRSASQKTTPAMARLTPAREAAITGFTEPIRKMATQTASTGDDVPGADTFGLEDGVGGGGDAAGERAGEAFGE